MALDGGYEVEVVMRHNGHELSRQVRPVHLEYVKPEPKEDQNMTINEVGTGEPTVNLNELADKLEQFPTGRLTTHTFAYRLPQGTCYCPIGAMFHLAGLSDDEIQDWRIRVDAFAKLGLSDDVANRIISATDYDYGLDHGRRMLVDILRAHAKRAVEESRV